MPVFSTSRYPAHLGQVWKKYITYDTGVAENKLKKKSDTSIGIA